MNPSFTGTIAEGKLQLKDRHLFLNHLNSLEGKQVEITVEKVKRKRSVNQNSYYWGVIVLLGRHRQDDIRRIRPGA